MQVSPAESGQLKNAPPTYQPVSSLPNSRDLRWPSHRPQATHNRKPRQHLKTPPLPRSTSPTLSFGRKNVRLITYVMSLDHRFVSSIPRSRQPGVVYSAAQPLLPGASTKQLTLANSIQRIRHGRSITSLFRKIVWSVGWRTSRAST